MSVLIVRRFIAIVLTVVFFTGSVSVASSQNVQNKSSMQKSSNKGLGEQMATDLLSAGISIAASLSGNVALALSAGLLTKYVTTYGIAGVKKLIDLFKGYEPRDLGEINLYYTYLLNIKRNLYFSLITIRKAVKERERHENIENQLRDLTNTLFGECESGCTVEDLDEDLVNYQFVNLALDMDGTIDVNRVLLDYEVKATYQYLMLLYLDLIIVEQKLIEAQYDVMANRVLTIKDELEKNVMISGAEKEYLFSVTTNLSLRWVNMRDQRRVTLGTQLAKTVRRLNSENDDMEGDLDDYRNRNKGLDKGDNYQGQLNNMVGELEDFGISMNVFQQNPFQTGTALKNYFLGEKTLLLQRDAFFQLKANKLESTDQVADYHHRLKVLRSHGNNILLQLLKALKTYAADDGGETGATVEEPKHKLTLEEIIEECKKDAACVADRLANPETSLTNILVDNFKFTGEIFKQLPYMHSIEVFSIYQLVQLIYLEVLYGRIKISRVEFDLFYDKQIALKDAIDNNKNLTEVEKNLHRAVVRKTLNKWKLRIAKRKFDAKEEFSNLSLKIKEKSAKVSKVLKKLRAENGKLLVLPKCKTTIFNSDRRRCKTRKSFRSLLKEVTKGKDFFIIKEEQKLPEEFWTKI